MFSRIALVTLVLFLAGCSGKIPQVSQEPTPVEATYAVQETLELMDWCSQVYLAFEDVTSRNLPPAAIPYALEDRLLQPPQPLDEHGEARHCQWIIALLIHRTIQLQRDVDIAQFCASKAGESSASCG